MKALQLTQQGFKKENFVISNDVALPTLGDDDLLVKVSSTALNPVDWKMAASGFLIESYPTILGCDVSGIVEAVGSKVTKFKKGDAIFGYTRLGSPIRGPFAEYAAVPEYFAFKKPGFLGFEEAATVPVGSFTASLGLYDHLKLPLPSKSQQSGEVILIWGGSSSVGAYAVQLAAFSGFKVISTCSPRNFEYVKSLGATHVLDYSSADVISQIKALTNASLKYAFDAIATPETAQKILQALSSSAAAQFTSVAAFTYTGEIPANVSFSGIVLKDSGSEAFFYELSAEISSLVVEKKLKPNRVEKVHQGLAGIFDGLVKLQSNQVSGVKLVANISETP